MTNVMSFRLGRLGFLPCHNPGWIVKASIVTVKCLVCTCEKHLPPELYLFRHTNKQTHEKKTRRRKTSDDAMTHTHTHTPKHPEGPQGSSKCTGMDNVLEKLVEHVVGDLLGSVSVEFEYLLPFGVEGVEGAELALAVAEENQEVLALVPGDLLEHALLGLSVDHAREDAVLHRVQNDRAVRTRCWLLVKSGT